MAKRNNKAMTKQERRQHKEFRQQRRKGRGKAWFMAMQG